jgi:hypothetical protein
MSPPFLWQGESKKKGDSAALTPAHPRRYRTRPQENHEVGASAGTGFFFFLYPPALRRYFTHPALGPPRRAACPLGQALFFPRDASFFPWSFAASEHVVDQRPVPIKAIRADVVKDRFMVSRHVALIDQFLGLDRGVAGIANLKGASHEGNGSHWMLA